MSVKHSLLMMNTHGHLEPELCVPWTFSGSDSHPFDTTHNISGIVYIGRHLYTAQWNRIAQRPVDVDPTQWQEDPVQVSKETKSRWQAEPAVSQIWTYIANEQYLAHSLKERNRLDDE